MNETKVGDDEFRVPRPAATLRHSVTESIRQAIAAGRFRPGERMPERDLCEMTGVSRTLVREALRQLESEGLIEVIAHKGPVVSRITAAQAIGVYQVREVLEGLAAELFAEHATDNDREALKAAFEEVKKADIAATRIALKNKFYDCLVVGTGNEALGKTLYMLNARTMLLRAQSLQAPNRWQQSLSELQNLLDALDRRDAAGAKAIATDHVRRAAAAAMHTFSMDTRDKKRRA
ncbi:GntR family transcriptional regulator [Afifella marina]|uniref:DNA-binding transcriptional regulator, GntR family n=1 Tax=Afifella marina DSM 2698 TaxID=1120955 RepID=A0A1G5M3M7_AFIMA|nr:GntR family transcriptional regulator [Afifella marina]MBK1623068.1 GntR family transcriptional regulator [Afifella marina DSM 2698]MBK1626062.1 GntR family transcriptional regulator [Afifella marina]MBK5917886.1 GntR family transcriptional regulator [Afifella marina]RAI18179.1 GntR family transcriptional regulator [Afifella marina DSM 2698]SCZ19381.1 DNA-binding transcriptional regulator, GntR family [Afifella marina DSM 2698]